MIIPDAKAKALADRLRAGRANMPHATSEEAYAQQARALRGETRAPLTEEEAKALLDEGAELPGCAQAPYRHDEDSGVSVISLTNKRDLFVRPIFGR